MSQAHPGGTPGGTPGEENQKSQKRSFWDFGFPQLRAFSRNDYPSLNSRLILSTNAVLTYKRSLYNTFSKVGQASLAAA